MPHAVKTSGRNASSAKSINRRGAGARTQKAQILSLSKKLTKVERKQHERSEHQTFAVTEKLSLAGYYNQRQLILPMSVPGQGSWTLIFGTNANLNESNSIKIKNITMKYTFDSANEENHTTITMFIITPKTRKVLQESYNLNSGDLNLISGTDYEMINGMALINKKRWKIHKYHRTETLMQGDSSVRHFPLKSNNGSFTMNPNWIIKSTTGVWSSVPADNLPLYMRMFVVCFNDNSAFDAESPTFTHNTLISTVAGG